MRSPLQSEESSGVQVCVETLKSCNVEHFPLKMRKERKNKAGGGGGGDHGFYRAGEDPHLLEQDAAGCARAPVSPLSALPPLRSYPRTLPPPAPPFPGRWLGCAREPTRPIARERQGWHALGMCVGWDSPARGAGWGRGWREWALWYSGGREISGEV